MKPNGSKNQWMSNEENIPCMVKITLYGIGNLIYGNLHKIGAN